MTNRIPKLFHFVFGLKEQTEPFHLSYYLCLKSCLQVNKPDKVHFYYHFEPYGEYWDLIKPHLCLIKVELETFVIQSDTYQSHQEGKYIKASNLDYAHQADFIRLKKLIEHGGVYADMDTLFVNPLPEFLYQQAFVIGREQDVTKAGEVEPMASLCNALMMSEPNSDFANQWLQASYDSFDGSWSSHSCQQAAKLALEIPDSLYVAPQHYFYKHMWTRQGIDTLFKGLDPDFEGVYSMHMWNHLWWDQSRVDLSDFHGGLITEKNIIEIDTTYNLVARRFLPNRVTPSNHYDKQESVDLKSSAASILYPRIAPGWALIQKEETPCFVHAQSGHSFVINEITKLIIEQCDGKHSVVSIIDKLSERFSGEAEDIDEDVKTILRDLALNGAIKFAQASNRQPLADNTPATPSKQYKLCIGMATYDDYDGVYFSVQAIRLYHPEVLDDIEFVVLDNNPTGVCAEALRNLGNSMPNYRYIAGDNFQGTWSRFSLIHQTSAPYVLCMDSHVMILPGAIKRLLDYFDSHADTPDLLQGPLVGDDLTSLSTHFMPGWGAGMFGTWANDSRGEDIDGDGFDIPMQGMGLFALRREHWPKVNPRFKGFGGEEGYVHEKVRRAGGRTLCLPFLRWIHRFNRPMGAHYALNWEDRLRNYMIAHDELAKDTTEMLDHFNEHIGTTQTSAIVAKTEAEFSNPFYQFDAIYCINLDSDEDKWRATLAQCEHLGFAHRVQRFSAIETPENHLIGCTLSHRSIVHRAASRGMKNVLVLEDDVIFDADTLAHLERSLQQAQNISWDIFYLGAHCWGTEYPMVNGGTHLREVSGNEAGPTCAHALVYSESSFSTVLQEFPDNLLGMAQYVEDRYAAIDQYLAADDKLKRVISEPRVASQPPLLKQEIQNFMPIVAR